MKESEENQDKVNEEIINLLKPSSEMEVGGNEEESLEKNEGLPGEKDQVKLQGSWTEKRKMKLNMKKWLAKFRKRKTRRAASQGYRSYQSRLGRWDKAKVVRTGALAAFIGVIGSVLLAGGLFAWYARDLPSPDKIVRRDGFSTKIYSREGELLYDVFDEQKRIPIDIEQVPMHLRQATIAIEDQDFYKHGGYDPKGILRAVLVNLSTGRRVGGSTLTQQLVKNGLLTSEKRLSRKIKEFVLAVQIERRFNKDEILQMYLNEIPYGGTAWGIAAAAETYFGKNVEELNLVESAILAGLPQRPSVYTPFGSDPKAYIDRTKHVLRRMREDGYITEEQEQEALPQIETIEFNRDRTGIKAAHFVFYVTDLLEHMYGRNLVEQGGLKVTTSLDYQLHEKAQQIVAEEVEKVADMNVGNGAALVMNPINGEILAMVGSKDFAAEDYDGQVNVTLSLRQPGSTIKPVTYALALERGLTPASIIMDVKTEFPGGQGQPPYIPVNYDGTYNGPVALRKALASSLNVPAVKLLAIVGLEDMLRLAYDMGFNTLEPTKENLSRFGLAVTLGGGEVRLIDLSSAYSAFANGGKRVDPVAILKVEDRDGKVLYEHKPVEGRRVLDEKVAFLINDILSDNDARLLTFGANSYLNMDGRPIAVKTGTTNDRRDNWTVGWSNSVMVGVWVGNNDNSEMTGVASGVTGASPIWRRIILEAVGKYPAQPFEKPAGVESVFVDAMSGYPEHDGFPSRSEYVIAGTLPDLPDPLHQKLKLCPGQNKLAPAGMIAGGRYDEKEYFTYQEDDPLNDDTNKWQEAIDAWMASQGDERYHPPKEVCEGGEAGVVRILKPEHEKDYDDDSVEIEVDVFADKKVEKLEIWINGSRKETLNGKPYKTKIKLDDGAYELQVKAELEGGDKIESGILKFGLGDISWDGSGGDEPTPSPTPKPTASPTPEPDED